MWPAMSAAQVGGDGLSVPGRASPIGHAGRANSYFEPAVGGRRGGAGDPDLMDDADVSGRFWIELDGRGSSEAAPPGASIECTPSDGHPAQFVWLPSATVGSSPSPPGHDFGPGRGGVVNTESWFWVESDW